MFSWFSIDCNYVNTRDSGPPRRFKFTLASQSCGRFGLKLTVGVGHRPRYIGGARPRRQPPKVEPFCSRTASRSIRQQIYCPASLESPAAEVSRGRGRGKISSCGRQNEYICYRIDLCRCSRYNIFQVLQLGRAVPRTVGTERPPALCPEFPPSKPALRTASVPACVASSLESLGHAPRISALRITRYRAIATGRIIYRRGGFAPTRLERSRVRRRFRASLWMNRKADGNAKVAFN